MKTRGTGAAACAGPATTGRRASAMGAAAGSWLIPIIFCLFLYWRGLFAWFQADDFAWLNLNGQVHHWRDLLHALFAPMAQGTIRPLSERAYFMAFEALFGVDALPYRICVFVVQCINLALVVSIATRLSGSIVAGVIAAVLWVANSALCLPMVWCSAFNQILCGVFLLGAFWCLLRYIETSERRWNIGQWALFILGFGALEIMVVYPALAGFYTYVRARKYLRSTLPMFVPSFVFGVVHMALAPPQKAGAYALHFDWTIPLTFLTYWRWALISSQTPARGAARLLFLAAAITVALLGFAILRARRGDWLPVFCLAWFAIVLTPLLPLRDHASDYYLFLPTIGPAILSGYALVKAWRRSLWWKIVGLALAAAYLLVMVRADRLAVGWWCDRSLAIKRMVLGVARAHELHPNQAILLDGVDSTLFWAGVFHRPFSVLGISNVYLTPGSESHIDRHPEQGNVADLVLPPGPALRGLKNQQIVVYAVDGDRLRNVTSRYANLALTEWSDHPPARIDVGNPFMAYLLGPGWYSEESGYRWMGGSAQLLIGGPRTAADHLYIKGYCASAQLEAGPLPLEITVGDIRLPPVRIEPNQNAFEFVFGLSQLVGKAELPIFLKVGRTFRPPGDKRDLGLAFGTFEIR